ncbi:protein-tyrosine phosphatase-like protein [Rhexocercosporidium sp. MPI-PUGE-AT-0058]|nr:protein-tyrosine phosphatase-like protein [Rhexocercosporidium sp. MPI-PUGE-AT-0058]
MSQGVSSEWYDLFAKQDSSESATHSYKSLDTLDNIPSLSFLRNLFWLEVRSWIQNDTTIMSVVTDDTLPLPGRIYLGGMSHALNNELLKERDIRAVITIHPRDMLAWDERDASYGLRRYCTDGSPVQNHLMIPLEDSSNSNLIDHFGDTYAFIHEHLKKGHNMLIHCKSGRSRSVAVLVAFLQRKHYETTVRPRGLAIEKAREEMKVYREAVTDLIRVQRLPVIIIMERFLPLLELYELQLIGHPDYELETRILFPQNDKKNLNVKGGAAVLKICIAILFYENNQKPLKSVVQRLLELNEAYFYELEGSEYNGRSYAESRHAHRGILKFYVHFAKEYEIAIPSAISDILGQTNGEKLQGQ